MLQESRCKLGFGNIRYVVLIIFFMSVCSERGVGVCFQTKYANQDKAMQFLCEYLNTVIIGGMGCEAKGIRQNLA